MKGPYDLGFPSNYVSPSTWNPRKVYRTKRGKFMRYPERSEGTRIIFYNVHLPGKKGMPGTPVGVVAFLISDDLQKMARGLAVRSLLDEWDPGEGRIRAAGRAIRAYKKHYDKFKGEKRAVAAFGHQHGRMVAGIGGFNDTKYIAPATPTPKEHKLLEKKLGVQIGSDAKHMSSGSMGG